MSYEIRNYEESFVEDQASLGTEVTTDWTAFGQSSAEQLKQTYSQDGFDPKTKFYAFKDGDMVGFLTSTIQEDDDGTKNAFVRLPIVREDHIEASYELTESFLDFAKDRGVKKITTGVKDDWGNYMELVDRFGFEFERDTTYMSRMSVDEISIESIDHDYTIEEVDTEKDAEALLDIFENSFGMSADQAKANLDAIAGFDEELIIGHPIIKEDGRIIARAWCQKVPNDETTAYFGNIYAPKNFKKHSRILLAYLLDRIKARGLTELQKNLAPNEVRKDYEEIGFDFQHTFKNYVKLLE